MKVRFGVPFMMDCRTVETIERDEDEERSLYDARTAVMVGL